MGRLYPDVSAKIVEKVSLGVHLRIVRSWLKNSMGKTNFINS